MRQKRRIFDNLGLLQLQIDIRINILKLLEPLRKLAVIFHHDLLRLVNVLPQPLSINPLEQIIIGSMYLHFLPLMEPLPPGDLRQELLDPLTLPIAIVEGPPCIVYHFVSATILVVVEALMPLLKC